jgi:hypothetical protein
MKTCKGCEHLKIIVSNNGDTELKCSYKSKSGRIISWAFTTCRINGSNKQLGYDRVSLKTPYWCPAKA